MTLGDRSHETAASLAGKYLPVTIRGVTYGIRCDRILAQAALSELLERTDLPKMVAGFITRRGRLIPVFDLHHALAGGSVPPMAITILVVQSRSDDQPGLPVGLCVDRVLAPVQVNAPAITVRAGYRHGDDELPCLGTIKGVMAALLDLDTIVEQSIFQSKSVSAA